MNKDAVAEMSQQYQIEAAKKLVPEGYKQTEVGVIPEDWEIVELGDLLSYEQPTRYLVDSSDYFETGTVPVLTAGKTFVLGYTSEHDNLYISLPVIIFDDFTTASKYVDFPFKAKSSAMKMLRPRNEQIPLQLVYSALNNIDFIVGDHKRHWISEFSKLKIAWPALAEEQAAIANALSDTDALLSELEKLIAKKQAIKTATMQQLLTGRTRLPQFAHHPDGSKKGYKQSELGEIPEDWETISFGETLSIRHGKNQKEVEASNGSYPIFGTGGQMGWAKSYLYDKPSVLIGRKGTINKPRYIDQPFWTVDTLFYSEINKEFCAKFIFYKFCQVDWEQYNEASGVPSLNAKTIENVSTSFPEIKEQTAIATILSDMDEEIQALEQRLNKTRQIKQGMMQQLLTGKVRLV